MRTWCTIIQVVLGLLLALDFNIRASYYEAKLGDMTRWDTTNDFYALVSMVTDFRTWVLVSILLFVTWLKRDK